MLALPPFLHLHPVLHHVLNYIYTHLLSTVHAYRSLYHNVRHTYSTAPGARPDERVVSVLKGHGTVSASLRLCVQAGVHHGEDAVGVAQGGAFSMFPSVEACYVLPWGVAVLLFLGGYWILPFLMRVGLWFLVRAVRKGWRIGRGVLARRGGGGGGGEEPAIESGGRTSEKETQEKVPGIKKDTEDATAKDDEVAEAVETKAQERPKRRTKRA